MDPAPVSHPAELPTDKCHLLDIPPEVRDSILKYLLISSPERVTYMSVRDEYIPQPDEIVKVPLAIACTCRQLFWEALPIYYSKNPFTFLDLSALHHFLKEIGPQRRSYVKNITINLANVPDPGLKHVPTAAMKLLGQCGPLNKLTIELSWAAGNNFFRSIGVAKLRDIRGCKEFHVNRDHIVSSGVAGLKEHLDEFESILRSEICAGPETEAEKKERLEDIIAKKKQNRVERKASLRPRV